MIDIVSKQKLLLEQNDNKNFKIYLLCFLRASCTRDGRKLRGRDLRKKNIITKVGGNMIKLDTTPTAI